MKSSERYSHNLIREYKYWQLFSSEYQLPYVGRCYAWWKDREPGEGEGLPLCSLPAEALAECFQTIFLDVVHACQALGHETDPYGRRFLLNTAYLANEMRHHNGHMHVHFIPRYEGILHVKALSSAHRDALWGKHYGPKAEQSLLPPKEQRTVNEAMIGAIG